MLTIGVGGLVALQAPMNGRLRATIGGTPAAMFNNLVGLSLLIVLFAAAGKAIATEGVRDVPWWAFLGGLCGALYVVTALTAVGTLGAGGVTAATIAGQLTVAVVVDQLGLLGVERHPITPLRLAGVVLLAAGVVLIVRD